MQDELTNLNTFKTGEGLGCPLNSENYSSILDEMGIVYKRIDVHLQVGEIIQTQGWILHISIVVNQIAGLLRLLLPALLSENIPFKVVQDRETAKSILNGNLGIELIGKIVTIYPSSAEKALKIAKLSIAMTRGFKGPTVLTDAYLGGNVYTRYGSFDPVVLPNAAGQQERYIYNAEGQLIHDDYKIPFILDKGLIWPFEELASFHFRLHNKPSHWKYKPTSLLKSDPKGNIFKALYLKNILTIKWCVIKEGKKNMWSDDVGRDMIDRILWQHELHMQLEPLIPIPRVLDLFSEEDNYYLVIEYISGKPLVNYIHNLNKSSVPWNHLPRNKRFQIIDFILQIISILDKLHANGYVHRDITPVNFIVTRNLQLYIIDNELAYSIYNSKPSPPFGVGTAGFMSQEQMTQQIPTISEDIYGLGATMIVLLTGLSPLTLETGNTERLSTSLNFLLNNKLLAETISNCLHPNPSKRPTLQAIKTNIQKHKGELQNEEKNFNSVIEKNNIDSAKLKSLIEGAIKGLVLPPTIIQDNLWYSSISTKGNKTEKQQFGFTLKPGLGMGILGILYLLAKAKKSGYNIDPCMKAYRKGWGYIEESYLPPSPNVAPGLYGGAAGLAVTMAEGIKSALISYDEQNLHLMQRCLQLAPVSLDFATGLAGQGVALMQCREYIENNLFQQLLTGYIQTLHSTQKNDGSWIAISTQQAKENTGSSTSNTGIILFLLEYLSYRSDEKVKNMASKGIRAIERYTHVLLQTLQKESYQNLSISRPTILEEIQGQLLMYLKGYEFLKQEKYKTMAEKLFNNLPIRLLNDNFSQESGLSGLGEIYLEGYRILNNFDWLERARWIAQLFMHTYHYDIDHFYWLGNNFKFTTADFMTGNSGIIHFLIRYLSPNKVGYRFIN